MSFFPPFVIGMPKEQAIAALIVCFGYLFTFQFVIREVEQQCVTDIAKE